MIDFMRFLYYWLVQIPFTFIACVVIVLAIVAVFLTFIYYMMFVLCFFTVCYMWLLPLSQWL